MEDKIVWKANKELSHVFKLKVTGAREMTIRYAIAEWLLKIVGYLAKMDIEIVK